MQKRGFLKTLSAMLGLCCVLIMVVLDQTVISTALPNVVADLKDFELYAWAGSSYLLISVIVIPIFGKLGDDYGRKPFVLIAILVFTLASLMCGLSQSMSQLILARSVQGIGGGMLIATSFACVPDLFPDHKRRLHWQALLSTIAGLANAVGPTLGGYLTEYLGWRAVFFMNLPIGLLSMVLVARYLPRIRHSNNSPAKMDKLGAILLALSLCGLQLSVESLHQGKPAWFLALATATLSSTCVLVWWENRCINPILPLNLITSREVGPIFGLSLLMGFCLFAVMYYTPLMLQGGFELSPNSTGLIITPMAVFIALGSIANGRIITRVSHTNRMLYVGLSLFLLLSFALTQTTTATPHKLIVISMTVGGIGIGIVLSNLTLFAQVSVSQNQLGVATAMLQSTRMVGGMLGTALIGALVSHHYRVNIVDVLSVHDGTQWISWVETPQILVDHDLALNFEFAVRATGYNPDPLLSGARNSLVVAIHYGQWIIVGCTVVAMGIALLVSPIILHKIKFESNFKNVQ